ncbi:MAG: hemerythrin domain-containing protein [Candidatus Manganitrophus sp. SB1]|nr:hemerythrin domain-containing protein [Candidatus Manganitrophus morganii]
MKATELLIEDHKTVKDLIQELKSAKDKGDLLVRLENEIQLHTQSEEQIFYPAMREYDNELVEHSIEEHQQVDQILTDLVGLTGKDFKKKLSELEKALDDHIEEEEGKLFPEAEENLGDQLNQLGEQIENLKRDLSAGGRMAA